MNIEGPKRSFVDLEDRIQKMRRRDREDKGHFTPQICIVTGSGLDSVAECMECLGQIPYAEIDGFPTTSVEGHAGVMWLGWIKGVPCVILQGRFHYYECPDTDTVVHAVVTAFLLGCRKLVLTNAAGAVNEEYAVGDVMVIEDHNSKFMPSPFMGPKIPEIPRFPDMSQIYDRRATAMLRAALGDVRDEDHQKFAVHTGIYAGLTGPEYETPAEVRTLRGNEIDAVGMSTVLEAKVFFALGGLVCGMSGVSNPAAGGKHAATLDHEHVKAEMAKVGPRMARALLQVISRLAALPLRPE